MSTVVAEGVDYAFTTVDPRVLYVAGKRFAMRYIGPGSAGKHLTAAERDELWAAGLGVVLLAEGLEGDIFAGRAVGRHHAQLARIDAAALGAPATRPIYYAADKDVTAANIDLAVDYFRGVNDEEPATEVGCYGDIDIMTRLRNLGLARWFYQAAAGAWSHGLYFPYNTVHQYHNGVSLAGGTVDLDRAYATDYGQWLPDGHTGGDMTAGQEYVQHVINYRVEGLVANRSTINVPAFTASDGSRFPAITETNQLAAALAGLAVPLPPVHVGQPLTDPLHAAAWRAGADVLDPPA